jgi:hypothetical protein
MSVALSLPATLRSRPASNQPPRWPHTHGWHQGQVKSLEFVRSPSCAVTDTYYLGCQFQRRDGDYAFPALRTALHCADRHPVADGAVRSNAVGRGPSADAALATGRLLRDPGRNLRSPLREALGATRSPQP